MTQNQVLKLPLATSGSPCCFVAPTVRFTSFEAIDQYQQVRLKVLVHLVAGWLLACEGRSSKDRCTELKVTGRRLGRESGSFAQRSNSKRAISQWPLSGYSTSTITLRHWFEMNSCLCRKGTSWTLFSAPTE